jgi:hypothetical protein
MSQPKSSPRDIVYDFAQILGQVNLPILDIRLLPHPKKAILDAFLLYEAQLSVIARHDATARKELEKVRSVGLSVYDFQQIDPEDMNIVMEINGGRRFARFGVAPISPEDNLTTEEEADLRVFMEYTQKYHLRSCRELGIKS